MIKKVTERQDLEKIHALASYAFNIQHTEAQKEAYLKKNTFIDNYVDETDSEITSQIVCYPYQVMIKDKVMKMAGIGDVASYPEVRGNGGIREIFSTIFEDLHEKGVELSYLAPFSQAFYRKFGYETVFDFEEMRIPKAVITQIKPEKQGYVKRVDWEDEGVKEIIKELYAKTLGTEHGALIREDYWWEYTVASNDQKKLAICFNDDNQAVGYLIYGLIGSTEFQLYEMGYQTSFALRKLMTFVASHNGSFDEFVSTNIRDTMVLELLTEMKDLTRKTYSNMMVKIVNFEQFMTNYPFEVVEETREIYVDVTDTSCSWNNGQFKLVITNGVCECTKVTQPERIDYRGSIQRFTQVFMGHHSLEKAIWLELIEDKSMTEPLKGLINAPVPHLYDYF